MKKAQLYVPCVGVASTHMAEDSLARVSAPTTLVQVLLPSVESDCLVSARRGMSSQKSRSVGSAACLMSPNVVSMMQSSIF